MAEWSKALVSGTSLRAWDAIIAHEFEPHSRQPFVSVEERKEEGGSPKAKV